MPKPPSLPNSGSQQPSIMKQGQRCLRDLVSRPQSEGRLSQSAYFQANSNVCMCANMCTGTHTSNETLLLAQRTKIVLLSLPTALLPSAQSSIPDGTHLWFLVEVFPPYVGKWYDKEVNSTVFILGPLSSSVQRHWTDCEISPRKVHHLSILRI